MRTPLLILGACGVVSCISAPVPQTPVLPAEPKPSLEYAGVYISTTEEDYFTSCDTEGIGDTWSLRFPKNEPRAPFLKKVAALRGHPPLTHFIRIRGRIGPPGSYNLGFQTHEVALDSLLDVRESLEPCPGFGAPAAWRGSPERLRNQRVIAMSADRRLLAVGDNQRLISIWSTETGQLVRKFPSLDKGDPRASGVPTAFSDDGELLAVGGADGIVRVWRPREGKRAFSLRLKDSAAVAKERAKLPNLDPPGWVRPLPPDSYKLPRQIVFNKRGTMLLTTNSFSSIVWSMKTGKKLAEFNIGNDFRRKIFFVGHEGLLMTADSGRMILRSHLDADPVTRPGTRAAATEHVAMSPDGRSIAVIAWSDSVFLWSVAEGPGRVLRVPGFMTGVMAFSPDGNTIAIAGGMFALYLYDTRTGAPIRAFHNFPGPVSSAWFSADGESIITKSHFDDRLRIVYVDASARAATEKLFDDSLTAKLPLGPPPSNSPRTIGGIVTGVNKRAVASAEVAISNGDAPDSVIARTTTSPGGYFSFDGIRFRHVLIRVQKPGFATGVKYIHLTWRESDGPWGIELTPGTPPAESGGT